MTIGDRIKIKRLANDNMTLEELSKKVGVSRQTLSRYETGAIAGIPYDRIESIAKALDVTPAYLMGWEDADGEQDLGLKELYEKKQGVEYIPADPEKVAAHEAEMEKQRMDNYKEMHKALGGLIGEDEQEDNVLIAAYAPDGYDALSEEDQEEIDEIIRMKLERQRKQKEQK